MLVLSRKIGKHIIINGRIKVTVCSIKGNKVSIGIEAPLDVSVDRGEVHERRLAFAEIDILAEAEEVTS